MSPELALMRLTSSLGACLFIEVKLTHWEVLLNQRIRERFGSNAFIPTSARFLYAQMLLLKEAV